MSTTTTIDTGPPPIPKDRTPMSTPSPAVTRFRIVMRRWTAVWTGPERARRRDRASAPPKPSSWSVRSRDSPTEKVAVYVGLIGTLALGIYPRPIINWIVDATLMFSQIVAPSASLPVATLPFGG